MHPFPRRIEAAPGGAGFGRDRFESGHSSARLPGGNNVGGPAHVEARRSAPSLYHERDLDGFVFLGHDIPGAVDLEIHGSDNRASLRRCRSRSVCTLAAPSRQTHMNDKTTTKSLQFVSLIMPVRNEAAFIERSLGAVLAQSYPRDSFEVIVVDGMSNDGTREIVAEIAQAHAKVTLLDNPQKIVATGLNAALRQAKGEVIIRVDGHCEIAPDYVRNCVEHIQRDRVEAVGGPVETIGESYVARVIAKAMSSRFGVGRSAFRIPNRKTQFADTVPFPAYTRAVIDRAGLFDEELVRNQDDEYNYRLRKLGVKILLAEEVRSRYFSRSTLRSLWRQYFQYGYWKVRVMQKHPRQMRLRQFGPPLFVAVLLTFLILLPLFPVAGYLAGLFAGGYAVAVLGASVLLVRNEKWELLPPLPIAFTILHLAYGAGFLVGLVKFWHRWGEGESKQEIRAAVRDGHV